MGRITPEVPAASGVHAGRTRLRVDYDDVVQFSDLVVTSVSSELVSKIRSEINTKQINKATGCLQTDLRLTQQDWVGMGMIETQPFTAKLQSAGINPSLSLDASYFYWRDLERSRR